MERQKVIVRLLDERLIKGYLDLFSPSDDMVSIEDESSREVKIKVEDMKGIFFVKSFAGDRNRKERKSFVGTTPTGKRVFVRFRDGESMMGYIEGDIPWAKGFFLESHKSKGFFLKPVDSGSNNTKVFVVATSVADVTFIG